jgi:division protein CdvB (Snf7/Vps24/ESCRT-III family)
MSELGSKFQARISALPPTADSVALQKSLTDFTNQITTATTQAQSVIASVSPLKPDNGNKTILASNTATLKSAKTKLKTVSADLKLARKDADAIAKGLKKLTSKATGSTTPITTATTPAQ